MSNKPEWQLHLEERIKVLNNYGCSCDINPQAIQSALNEIGKLKNKVAQLELDLKL